MSRNFEILQKANRGQNILDPPSIRHVDSDKSLLHVEKESAPDKRTASYDTFPENSLPAGLHQDAQSPSVPAHDTGNRAEEVKHSPLGALAQQYQQRRSHFRLNAFARYAELWNPGKWMLKNHGSNQSGAILNEEIKLVQRVFLAERSNAPHLVLFCAVESGNGCTSVCVGAGKALAAQVSGEVCIVDANLRTPALHRHFGLDNYGGLTEMATQSDRLGACTHVLPGSNLSVLTSGQLPRDPYALLGPASLKPLMAELRSRFDFVLIDSPPVSSYGDATLLAQVVDGVVLVIEADSTHMEAAQEAKERLDTANLQLLAAVLTKRTFPIPEALYRKFW